jgi:hypothetical protein
MEGVKIWCKWLRNGLNLAPSRGPNLTLIKRQYGGDSIIRAAASHTAGNQQLLRLWRDSGVASLLGKGWANHTLKTVAELEFSVMLATYLLEQGADVNHRPSDTHRTALQRAAKYSSAEGAEMIRFLLLNGADPEADQQDTKSHNGTTARQGKKIRDEEGAKGIHRWLGMTWDELVEETKRIRNEKEAGKVLMSKVGEGD